MADTLVGVTADPGSGGESLGFYSDTTNSVKVGVSVLALALDPSGAGGVDYVDAGSPIPINATALPLPAGAATSDNQVANGVLLSAILAQEATAANQTTANTALAAIKTAVEGTLTVGSHAVTNAGVFAVQSEGKVAEGAAASGADPVQIAGRYDATPRLLADGEQGALALTSAGYATCSIPGTVTVASHAVTNAGTFAVQVTGSALTALQLIDDVIYTDDAAFTPATSKVAAVGYVFDDTTPDSVDEGDIGAARMSANRNQYMTIRDAAGNERGLNIDASGRAGITIEVNNAGLATAANQAALLSYVDGLESYLDQVEGYLDGVEDLLTTINAGVTTVNAYLLQIDNDTSTLAAVDFATQTTLAAAVALLTTIDSNTSTINTNVNSLTGYANSIDTKLVTEDLDSGGGTDTCAVIGLVAQNSGGRMKIDGIDLANANALRVALVDSDGDHIASPLQTASFTAVFGTSGMTTTADLDDGVSTSINVLNVRNFGYVWDATGAVWDRQAGSAADGTLVYDLPRTTGGYDIFRSIDLDETEEAVKASAGQVFGWYLFNAASSTRFVKLYNATVASVVVGTTTPVMTIPVPAGSGANIEFSKGIPFSTAITAAATTGVADSDTGAPAANEVVANILYK